MMLWESVCVCVCVCVFMCIYMFAEPPRLGTCTYTEMISCFVLYKSASNI